MTYLRRLPFTLLMELLIIIVAVTHGSIWGHLSQSATLRWGVGLHNLWEGRFYTFITSTFFVRDLRMFAGMIFLIGYSVGIYEWLRGTKRAIMLYWSTNLLAPLLACLFVVLPLYLAGTAIGQELAFLSDMGASAGAAGCVGGSVSQAPHRYRKWLFGFILLFLVSKLLFFPEPFADTIHLIAFPIGFAIERRLWFTDSEAGK